MNALSPATLHAATSLSAATASADADLIAAVNAYFKARTQRPSPLGLEKVCGTIECERYEEVSTSHFDHESDLFKAAAVIPARTMVGLRAKARLIKAWEEHDWHVDSLLDDLLAGDVA